jgi:hypothetical protein
MDEAQDTSRLQYQLFYLLSAATTLPVDAAGRDTSQHQQLEQLRKALTRAHLPQVDPKHEEQHTASGEVCLHCAARAVPTFLVAGDDDQSIYAFQGGDPSCIEKALRPWRFPWEACSPVAVSDAERSSQPRPTIFCFKNNYRSAPPIVDFSQVSPFTIQGHGTVRSGIILSQAIIWQTPINHRMFAKRSVSARRPEVGEPAAGEPVHVTACIDENAQVSQSSHIKLSL